MIQQEMVFRRRFGNAMRPIHRIKHVVDIQNGQVAGTQTDNVIIATTDAPVLANVTEVETGATVNGIYLKIEAYATSTAALANFYMIVWKSPGGNLTAPVPNSVGSNDDKRYVIHQEMVMLEKNTTGNPRTIFAGVIALPRGLRRCGPNDNWLVSVLSPGVTSDFCIQCIYKEFR